MLNTEYTMLIVNISVLRYALLKCTLVLLLVNKNNTNHDILYNKCAVDGASDNTYSIHSQLLQCKKQGKWFSGIKQL